MAILMWIGLAVALYARKNWARGLVMALLAANLLGMPSVIDAESPLLSKALLCIRTFGMLITVVLLLVPRIPRVVRI